jgi:hypothetical protein
MLLSKGFWLVAALLVSTLAQAADYEEVSYDDLVNQINKRKNSVVRDANDPLDNIKLHAGVGLLTSANNINTGQGSDTLKYQNGFQLSLGIDLFSPEWAAETALRNFGQAKSGSETRSLREFDLKLMHRHMLSSSSGFRLGAGIGTRYLKIDDVNVNIDDTTPTALIFGGLDIYAAKNFSVGIESGFRTSMVNQTSDRGSLDLTVRLDTYF